MKSGKTQLPASFRTEAARGPIRKTTLALSISAAIAGPFVGGASAQEVINLDTLSIEDRTLDYNPYAEPGAPYKAKISGDARRQLPLAETAANISVLTSSQIRDSGYTDLKEILDAQPGITLGTGENGNAFGDRYIIRGQEARSDVFVDGLRDPGMTIRESFATEQVEITKGPSSTFAGRGSVGGAINSVTKQANPEYDFSEVSAGMGTDDYRRIALDTNRRLSDSAAVRVNLLHAYEEVPNRGPTDRERNGLAVSGLVKANDKLDLTLDYYGLRAEDNPDLGGYGSGGVPVSNPLVYAQSEDFLESDVDTFTLKLDYDINDATKITNTTRYGVTDNGYVATGASPGTRYPTETDLNNSTNGFNAISLSTHQGWQEVDYLANHTNLFFEKELGGKKHEFIVGLELTDHKVLNGVYTATANEATKNCWYSGRGGASSGHCVTANGQNNLTQRSISKGNWDSDWNASAIGLSLMDKVELTEKLIAEAGVRHDWTTIDLKTTGTSGVDISQDENMWNGHVGLTYKFRPDAMVYASYATAADLNGGESDVGTSGAYGGLIVDNNASAEPERTENIELGTKWNLNDGKLLATAAVFQITKSDVMEAAGGGYDPTGSLNTGKHRVRGIEFGLAGNLTEKLSGQGGLTVMDSEVLESAVDPDNVGKKLGNFADQSAFLQLRYQATPVVALGGKVKYEDERLVGSPDAAGSTTNAPVPSFTTYDLFANYRLSKKANLQLNVENIFDKEYYLVGYRSGSKFYYMGDARNATLTMNYEF